MADILGYPEDPVHWNKTVNMDNIQREIARAKEGGRQRLNLYKSNMTSLPTSIKVK